MLNPAMAVVEVARERVLGGAERLPRAAGRPPLARSGRRPLDAESASVDLAFERGVPVAINGVPMPLSELTAALGTICGAPGLRVLGAARREVQKLTLAKDVDRFLRVVGRQYADLIDRGGWYSPLRRALDVLVDHVQERVTGVIRMQVRRGECRIVGLPARTAAAKSPLPRRQPRPVSMLVR
jgi:argininosuccinate synthase